MAGLSDIVKFANTYLNIDQFDDYCPNGLQVEGGHNVTKILTAVTASQAVLDGAVEQGVDMVMVHHGYFWRGEAEPITGLKYKKIRTLIDNNISLLAYHLPLDAHPECGNNAQLAKLLGVKVRSCFGPGKIQLVVSGELAEPIPVYLFVEQVRRVTGREPLHIGADKNKLVRTVGICTGGAQNYFSSAIDYGVDIYVTGEVSEQNFHMAIESGVDFISAGHHATERYGVQALGDVLCNKFSIQANYFEISNPI
ncbi:MAG: Nif3-like dinuclear metal center hexameric protein [Gammaproteobacteria bacterium]|nr:Nif3-like dinuclear metal center hexameric protein [Gammaproteobacteria bacterium]